MGREPGRKAMAGAAIMVNKTPTKAPETHRAAASTPSPDSDTYANITTLSPAAGSHVAKLGRSQFRGYLRVRTNDR
jgi:hypothetical protein